jgi:hypothetical protein
LQIALSAMVVPALVVLSTGQLEHWLCSTDHMLETVELEIMGPNFECLEDDTNTRLLSFILLEHVRFAYSCACGCLPSSTC